MAEKTSSWENKPNSWLRYNGNVVACWYSPTKAISKKVAKSFVDICKKGIRNKKVLKKDFRLTMTAKGENDA